MIDINECYSNRMINRCSKKSHRSNIEVDNSYAAHYSCGYNKTRGNNAL